MSSFVILLTIIYQFLFEMETVKVLNIEIQNITRQELLENLKEGVLVTPNLDQ